MVATKRDDAARPKVLFLHQGGELYGSDNVFYQVIRELSPYVDPIIVLDNTGPLVDKLKEISSTIIIKELGVLRRKFFNLRGMLNIIFLVFRSTLWLANYIRQENISLVYTNTSGVLPGAFAAKLSGRPHIWHVHEIILKPALLGNVLAFLQWGFSRKIIANSYATAAHLSQKMPANSRKTVVIHNSIVADSFNSATHDEDVRAEFGIEDKTILIGIIGRIHQGKGQGYFLDAAQVMKKAGFENFKVLVVGDVFEGNESLLEELKIQVAESGIERNIIFCGFRDDVSRLLKAIDIVVVPSTLPESFGLVALEAMAARKPVVATAIGGSLEIVLDGITGFLVPTDDSQVMAERLIALSSDKDLRERTGSQGRNRFESTFSLAQFSSAVCDVVLSTLTPS
jgi:glycosyltransferase involved in cell wall biosynthesis